MMRQPGADHNLADLDRIASALSQTLDKLCRRRFAERRLLASSWFLENRSVLRHDIIEQTKTWTNG